MMNWTDPGLWAVVDFVVLAVLLVKLGGPAIAKVFADKRDAIAKAVASAEQALFEAQRTLDEQQRTEEDAAKILNDIDASARAVAATLAADFDRETEAERARAHEAARAEIDRERRAMLSAVRAEIVRAAFTEAERGIRESLAAPQRQRDLFAAFAARAGEVRP